MQDSENGRVVTIAHDNDDDIIHWGKADDRNCNYGHPKMADVESGKNLLGDKIVSIMYFKWHMHWYDSNL